MSVTQSTRSLEQSNRRCPQALVRFRPIDELSSDI